MTVSINDFDGVKLNISNPVKKNDKYIADLTYNKTSLVIQTPKVGICDINERSLGIVINTNSFYNFLGTFDELVINTILKKSEEWFSQKLTIDQCHEIYKRSIISPYNSDLQPSMFIKITEDSKVFDSVKEMDIKDVKLDDNIICLIKCDKLIFYRTYCVPHWEIIQIKIKKKKLDTREYLIKDIEDDNIEIKNPKIPEIPNLNNI